MAETQSKRPREETHHELEETLNKRQKYSYNDILSLLDSSEEEEPSQDLSSLITTLQQELSSSDSGFDPIHISTLETDPENPSSSSSSSFSSPKDDNDQEDDKESVMRHLLEASDDELGIPNRNDAFADGGGDENDGFGLGDHGLWELEDETANYYTLLQSDLFL